MTPREAAVPGISCMMPTAPAWLTAFGLKPDSALAIDFNRSHGTPYREDASAKIGSRSAGHETEDADAYAAYPSEAVFNAAEKL